LQSPFTALTIMQVARWDFGNKPNRKLSSGGPEWWQRFWLTLPECCQLHFSQRHQALNKAQPRADSGTPPVEVTKAFLQSKD